VAILLGWAERVFIVRLRRILLIAGRYGEGLFIIQFAELRCPALPTGDCSVHDLRPGKPPEGKLDGRALTQPVNAHGSSPAESLRAVPVSRYRSWFGNRVTVKGGGPLQLRRA
jgi:hypothetical protein